MTCPRDFGVIVCCSVSDFHDFVPDQREIDATALVDKRWSWHSDALSLSVRSTSPDLLDCLSLCLCYRHLDRFLSVVCNQ